MLRALMFPFRVLLPMVAVTACGSATGGDPRCDLDCDFGQTSPHPKILGLKSRYAVGTRARVRMEGKAPVVLESSDSDVVRIQATIPGEAILSFLREGRATVTARNEAAESVHAIEVAPHATFRVLLGEANSDPLGPLSGQLVLGGPQYVLVLYLDADGRQLFGGELAEIDVSEDLRRCGRGLGSVDRHCFRSSSAGSHVVTVRVGQEEHRFEYETVPATEIVRVELLQPEEGELTPGTRSQIDVVGVLGDGRRVSSLHPRFYASDDRYLGYLAYQYDPDADPTSVQIRVLGRHLSAEVCGVPSPRAP